jgi:dCMP deaminase
MKIVIAYVPVLHEGYHKFFLRHKDAEILYVLGPSLIGDFRPLVKDIRAIDSHIIAPLIRLLSIFPQTFVLEKNQIQYALKDKPEVVMPDEIECVQIASEYFGDLDVTFDPVFLRWDKKNSISRDPVQPVRIISQIDADKEMMSLASDEARRSVDWWRQVGAVVARNGTLLVGAFHNKHVPTNHALMVFGDPRASFKRGIHLEASTVLHSEAAVIAWAARDQGISLLGADLYVTTFPCPPCAKLIAYSGVKRLFYRDGYAVLDGQDSLESQGVEIIQVQN